MTAINNKLLPVSRDECLHTLQLIHNLFYNNVTESQEHDVVYVLECYFYKYEKNVKMMYSNNKEKLNKFIELAVDYHSDSDNCEQTFSEYCQGKCKKEWVESFGSLYLALNNHSRKEHWWNESRVSEIILDEVLYNG